MEVHGLQLPYKETRILPVGDLQLGAEGADKRSFRRFIEWGIAHDAYYVGTGDYVDFMSPSNRRRYSASDLYDDSRKTIERAAQELVEEFLHLIRGTENRWLGLVHGHHLFKFEDGTTTDSRIARGLGCPAHKEPGCLYMGTTGFIVLQYQRGGVPPSGGKRLQRCTLFIEHGQGGGRKQGAPLNKIEDRQSYVDADFYFMGHTTKRPVVPTSILYVSHKEPHKVLYRRRWLVNTGGWLQGYHQGNQIGALPEGGYVEKGGLPPVDLGGTMALIKPRHSNNDDWLATWAGASGEEVDL